MPRSPTKEARKKLENPDDKIESDDNEATDESDYGFVENESLSDESSRSSESGNSSVVAEHTTENSDNSSTTHSSNDSRYTLSDVGDDSEFEEYGSPRPSRSASRKKRSSTSRRKHGKRSRSKHTRHSRDSDFSSESGDSFSESSFDAASSSQVRSSDSDSTKHSSYVKSDQSYTLSSDSVVSSLSDSSDSENSQLPTVRRGRSRRRRRKRTNHRAKLKRGRGKPSLDEYVEELRNAIRQRGGQNILGLLGQEFRRFDELGKGSISVEGLRQFTNTILGLPRRHLRVLSESQSKELMSRIDTRDNGRLDYDELVSFISMTREELMDKTSGLQRYLRKVTHKNGGSEAQTFAKYEDHHDNTNQVSKSNSSSMTGIPAGIGKIGFARMLNDAQKEMKESNFTPGEVSAIWSFIYPSQVSDKIPLQEFVDFIRTFNSSSKSEKSKSAAVNRKRRGSKVLNASITHVELSNGGKAELSHRANGFHRLPINLNSNGRGSRVYLWYKSQDYKQFKTSEEFAKARVCDLKLTGSKVDTSLQMQGFECTGQNTNQGAWFVKPQYLWIRREKTETNAIQYLYASCGNPSQLENEIWSPPWRGYKRVNGNLNRGNSGKGVFLWYWKESFVEENARTSDPLKAAALRIREKLRRQSDSRMNDENDSDVIDLKKVWTTHDSKGNGWISVSTLKKALDDIGLKIPSGDVAQIAKLMDQDGDGKVSKSEFFTFFAFNPAAVEKVAERLRNKIEAWLLDKYDITVNWSVKSSRSETKEAITSLFRKLKTDTDSTKLSSRNLDELAKRLNAGISSSDIKALASRLQSKTGSGITISYFCQYLFSPRVQDDAEFARVERATRRLRAFTRRVAAKQSIEERDHNTVDSARFNWDLAMDAFDTESNTGEISIANISKVLKEDLMIELSTKEVRRVLRRMGSTNGSSLTREQLIGFASCNSYIDSILNAIVDTAGSGHQVAFQAFDSNSDGTISRKEFSNVLKTMQIDGEHVALTPSELDLIVQRFDRDGDGKVDMGEFLSYAKHMQRVRASNQQTTSIVENQVVSDPKVLHAISVLRSQVLAKAKAFTKRSLRENDSSVRRSNSAKGSLTKGLRDVFKVFDTDGNGCFKFHDFESGMLYLGVLSRLKEETISGGASPGRGADGGEASYLTTTQMESVFARLDTEGTGSVRFDQFERFVQTVPTSHSTQAQRPRTAGYHSSRHSHFSDSDISDTSHGSHHGRSHSGMCSSPSRRSAYDHYDEESDSAYQDDYGRADSPSRSTFRSPTMARVGLSRSRQYEIRHQMLKALGVGHSGHHDVVPKVARWFKTLKRHNLRSGFTSTHHLSRKLQTLRGKHGHHIFNAKTVDALIKTIKTSSTHHRGKHHGQVPYSGLYKLLVHGKCMEVKRPWTGHATLTSTRSMDVYSSSLDTPHHGDWSSGSEHGIATGNQNFELDTEDSDEPETSSHGGYRISPQLGLSHSNVESKYLSLLRKYTKLALHGRRVSLQSILHKIDKEHLGIVTGRSLCKQLEKLCRRNLPKVAIIRGALEAVGRGTVAQAKHRELNVLERLSIPIDSLCARLTSSPQLGFTASGVAKLRSVVAKRLARSISKSSNNKYGSDGSWEHVFGAYDRDGTGQITRSELKSGLLQLGVGLNTQQMQAVFSGLALNEDGRLDYEAAIAHALGNRYIHLIANGSVNSAKGGKKSRIEHIKQVLRIKAKELAALRANRSHGPSTRQSSVLSPANRFSDSARKTTWQYLLEGLERFDRNDSGSISKREFRTALAEMGVLAQLEPSDVRILFEELCPGGIALVNLKTFMDWLGPDQRSGDELIQLLRSEIRSRARLGQATWKSFQTLDNNGDGKLSIHEFRKLVASVGVQVSDDETIAMFNMLDKDGSQRIDFNEFCTSLAPTPIEMLAIEARLKQQIRQLASTNGSSVDLERAFEMFDVMGTGVVTRKAFQQACARLGLALSGEELSMLLDRFDINQDNTVDYFEFCKFLSYDGAEISKLTQGVGSHLQTLVRTRGVHPLSVFRTIDTEKLGVVSRREFRRVLQRDLGLCLNDAEIMALSDLYSEFTGGDRIKYEDFVRAMLSEANGGASSQPNAMYYTSEKGDPHMGREGVTQDGVWNKHNVGSWLAKEASDHQQTKFTRVHGSLSRFLAEKQGSDSNNHEHAPWSTEHDVTIPTVDGPSTNVGNLPEAAANDSERRASEYFHIAGIWDCPVCFYKQTKKGAQRCEMCDSANPFTGGMKWPHIQPLINQASAMVSTHNITVSPTRYNGGGIQQPIYHNQITEKTTAASAYSPWEIPQSKLPGNDNWFDGLASPHSDRGWISNRGRSPRSSSGRSGRFSVGHSQGWPSRSPRAKRSPSPMKRHMRSRSPQHRYSSRSRSRSPKKRSHRVFRHKSPSNVDDSGDSVWESQKSHASFRSRDGSPRRVLRHNSSNQKSSPTLKHRKGRSNNDFAESGWESAKASQRRGGWESPNTKPKRDAWESPKTSQRRNGWESPKTSQRRKGWESPKTSQRRNGWESPKTSQRRKGWESSSSSGRRNTKDKNKHWQHNTSMITSPRYGQRTHESSSPRSSMSRF